MFSEDCHYNMPSFLHQVFIYVYMCIINTHRSHDDVKVKYGVSHSCTAECYYYVLCSVVIYGFVMTWLKCTIIILMQLCIYYDIWQWFNPLWPSDAIWRRISWSTLVQVMAWCLMAPSHCLNQCWLVINDVLWYSSEIKFTAHIQAHGGTTEEGNCSYLLPRAAEAGSNGTNKGQIHKVAVDEIARFLVYRMNVIRSQLTANTGIPVCLVLEIWQFKVFTGKEVTPLHEEGNSLQFRAGKKATHFIANDSLIYDKQIRLNPKKGANVKSWTGNICVTMWWADENHVFDTTSWWCQEHDRDRMATFETHFKKFYSCEMTTKCNISWDCRSTLFVYTNWFLSVLHVEVDPFRINLKFCHYGNSQCRDECYTTALSMRCGYGLTHGTKRRKNNQSEKLNHLYKTKYTKLFWYQVSRLRLYKMRVLKYYVENKAQLETWK